jgi:hypothetical protein
MSAHALKHAIAAEEDAMRELEDAALITREHLNKSVVGKRIYMSSASNLTGGRTHVWPLVKQHARLRPQDTPIPIGHVAKLTMKADDGLQNLHQHQKQQMFHPPKAVAFDGKSLEERSLPSMPARRRKAPFTAAPHAKMPSDGYGTPAFRSGFPLLEMRQATAPRWTWMSLLGACEVCIEDCNYENHGVAVPGSVRLA